MSDVVREHIPHNLETVKTITFIKAELALHEHNNTDKALQYYRTYCQSDNLTMS